MSLNVIFFIKVYSFKMFLLRSFFLETFVPGNVENYTGVINHPLLLHVEQDVGDSMHVRHDLLCLIIVLTKII